MKKGISIWSFTEPDLRKCFEIAKDAGFDGVEERDQIHPLILLFYLINAFVTYHLSWTGKQQHSRVLLYLLIHSAFSNAEMIISIGSSVFR